MGHRFDDGHWVTGDDQLWLPHAQQCPTTEASFVDADMWAQFISGPSPENDSCTVLNSDWPFVKIGTDDVAEYRASYPATFGSPVSAGGAITRGFASPNLTETSAVESATTPNFDAWDGPWEGDSSYGAAGYDALYSYGQPAFTYDSSCTPRTPKSNTTPNNSPNHSFQCTFTSCSEPLHPTSSALAHHHRRHAKSLLHSFPSPSSSSSKTTSSSSIAVRCPWPSCTSRAKFSNAKQLSIHLTNIHVTPLVCETRGCGYQKPFRNKHDLERHKRTQHVKARDHMCPWEECRGKESEAEGGESGKGVGFARKDKLLCHIREVHMNGNGKTTKVGEEEAGQPQMCPIAHCSVLVGGEEAQNKEKKKSRETILEHMKRNHGAYECGLGRCAGRQSQFSESGLEMHLRWAHRMKGGEALRVVDAVKRGGGDKTVRVEHLGANCKWEECRDCER
ncbi:hypothetical protein ACMFMF_011391 [Clarireedia jacksonii]